jgi:hypothetical protein
MNRSLPRRYPIFPPVKKSQRTKLGRAVALTSTKRLCPERPSSPQFRSPPAFRSCRHALLDMGANPRLMSDEQMGAIHGQQAETE